ncbi:Sepiapterin reductase [Seminavis robusta]|uniref:Sepiapterin reductase n=1 Tax=Seminavis robusta TaxID=568900 RepID=A0A9N8H2P4_9STRA|nr:Sepiapterin reductase [Seminavis robusta]|eukprot:Sro70_g038820.1 Sepiapterin reductase (268) ;mRNA; r:41238-42041
MQMLLIVTGASKGLGKAITTGFCCMDSSEQQRQQLDRLHVVLAARSANLLEELGRTIMHHNESTKVRVTLSCFAVDLSDLDQLDSHFDRMFQEVNLSGFDRVVFVNNAGSLGYLGPCSSSPSLMGMKATIEFNVTSALWLSSRFAQLVQENSKDTQKVTLINISSLLAVEAFPTMGIYAAGKAARDNYHATMAKEMPRIKVLNYAPGPLETDMVKEIRAAPKLDKSLKPAFDKKLIDPHDSAKKLVNLVFSDKFESGSHVDYYDISS